MSQWSQHLPAQHRLASWLSAGGSLTAHIRRVGHDFRVSRLSQRCGLSLPEECAVLGRHRGVLAREVLLMEGVVPLVFAHSVVAQEDTYGAWRAVRGLGSRPLAELLFADRDVSRQALQYRIVTATDPLGRRILRALPQSRFPFWARRSVFRKHGAPLLVTEVFLPAITEWQP